MVFYTEWVKKFSISAFISAWRSVWDVLRYDFAEKYLGIRRDVELGWDRFKKVSQNQTTKLIVEWCERKYNILKENPLWEIRHHNIHRGIIEMDREQRAYPIDIDIYGSVVFVDAIREKYEPEPSVSSREGQNLRFVFRFGHRYMKQVEGKRITPICEDAIKLMKDIVKEASEKFCSQSDRTATKVGSDIGV